MQNYCITVRVIHLFVGNMTGDPEDYFFLPPNPFLLGLAALFDVLGIFGG